MEDLTLREQLHKRVIDQIIDDMVRFGDWEAADELLSFCPVENLINFLPDNKQEEFKSLTI